MKKDDTVELINECQSTTSVDGALDASHALALLTKNEGTDDKLETGQILIMNEAEPDIKEFKAIRRSRTSVTTIRSDACKPSHYF